MLPEDLIDLQMSDYDEGSDSHSEHYRHGALQYWLRTKPTPDILKNLVTLASADPDKIMGEHFVNIYIKTHIHCNEEVKNEISRVGF